MFGIYDMTVFLLLCFQNQRLGTLVSLSISGENPSGQTLIGRLCSRRTINLEILRAKQV